MLFLIEAHFKSLRPPLRLWLLNESVSGLIFWFWFPVGSARKTRQLSNWQFTNCLDERDFEQTTPNIGILYTVGNDFSPQLAIWDSYLKIKPRLVQLHCQSFDSLSRKTCFAIRPLSLRTNGTNTRRRLRGTCGDLEPLSKVAGDDISSWLRRGLTWAIDGISAADKLPYHPSLLFEAHRTMCEAAWWPELGDLGEPWMFEEGKS